MAWRPQLSRALLQHRPSTPTVCGRNPNPSLETSLSRDLLLTLQWRFRSDVAQPPPSQIETPEGEAKNEGIGGSSSSVSLPFYSSMNQAELEKFAAIADTWWDHEGPFKPLHLMNPIRMSFIRSTLCRHFRKDPYCGRPFEGLKIIDVGCGGGILSEPLARMGATVTGIDAVEKNVKIAHLHAGLDPVTSSIEYRCTTAEQMVEEQKKFDAVIALEVIEHVADPSEFCKSLAALAVPSGATVISTINRSIRAYGTAIIAAEYLLNWVTMCVKGPWPHLSRRWFGLVVGDSSQIPHSNLEDSIMFGPVGIENIIKLFALYWKTRHKLKRISVFGVLPKGTHQWSSFLTPEELVLILQRASISVQEMAGFVYNPLTREWTLSDDTSVNYIAFGTKNSG